MRKPLFLHIPLAEKILFAKHLSIMVKSGMTLLDSLVLLKKQTRSRSFGYILDRMVADVQNGQFLSDSMIQFRGVFGELMINIIQIGEHSGNLADNLIYLAVELKKKQQLRQKVRAALIYPAVIFFATVGITGILIFFVLPKITPIFVSLKVQLPTSTKVLIAASDFIFNYGVVAFIAFLFLIGFWFFLLRFRWVRLLAHHVILLIPVLNSVAKMANTADFTRTLGLLLKSGTKIVEAITVTAASTSNLVYQNGLRDVAEGMRSGTSLHLSLAKNEHLFFPTVTRMIEVGETTGSLENNLFYLAEFYESEVDEVTKNLSNVLEPLLLLIMGGIVGFVSISIMTPIYQVTQTLGK